MKKPVFAFPALAAILMVSTAAQAQGQGGGRFGGGMGGRGGYALLSNKGVQKELKLSDDKAEKVTAAVTEINAKLREKMQEIPQEERREKMPELMKAHNEEVKAAVKDLLTAEQFARLDQIVLQQRGLEAFADAKVKEKLSLSSDQAAKIQDISEDTREQSREIMQSFQDDREGAMQKMATLRKESFEKAAALLSDDQKKSWKEMTGEPFEVRFERRPGA
ncbi:hypothetical protein ACYOEI_14235 [Singulisphaera rosea]